MFTGRFVLPLSSAQFNDLLAGGKMVRLSLMDHAGLLAMWIPLAFAVTAVTYQASSLPVRPITTAM
ncbi:MAG: hypothetical protein ABI324_04840 [Ktedonobacteraceae bacterium]